MRVPQDRVDAERFIQSLKGEGEGALPFALPGEGAKPPFIDEYTRMFTVSMSLCDPTCMSAHAHEERGEMGRGEGRMRSG